MLLAASAGSQYRGQWLTQSQWCGTLSGTPNAASDTASRCISLRPESSLIENDRSQSELRLNCPKAVMTQRLFRLHIWYCARNCGMNWWLSVIRPYSLGRLPAAKLGPSNGFLLSYCANKSISFSQSTSIELNSQVSIHKQSIEAYLSCLLSYLFIYFLPLTFYF